jgi:LacI family repressor for deo operon, udp, cdd, tsx, nupC, and nupG
MVKAKRIAVPRISINTVAERAEVSIATVSRVMSGSSTVNPDMAERVRRAAAELGYRPNESARALASGLHRIIGLVMPDMANPHFFGIVQRVADAAGEEDFRVVVADTRGDPAVERQVCEDLLAHCDGLVLISPRMARDELRMLVRRPQPVVAINRVTSGVDMPAIGTDNFTAMTQICRHLMDLGHEKVVYLSGSPLTWQSRERWRGIENAGTFGLAAAQVIGVAEIDGNATISSGHARVDEVLSHDPTAVICFNDLSAFGLMAGLRERGLSVPKDISVTGFDDIELARYCNPGLTTVRAPSGQLGAMAWKLLSEMLLGNEVDEPDLVRAEIILRESTAAPGS